MFNLEKVIADWRQQMVAAGIDSVELLDELEIHLREDVEHLGPQQAFHSAVRRLGSPLALGMEFGDGTCRRFATGARLHWHGTRALGSNEIRKWCPGKGFAECPHRSGSGSERN